VPVPWRASRQVHSVPLARATCALLPSGDAPASTASALATVTSESASGCHCLPVPVPQCSLRRRGDANTTCDWQPEMIGKKKKQAKPLQQAVVLVVRAGPATRPGVLEEHRHGVDATVAVGRAPSGSLRAQALPVSRCRSNQSYWARCSVTPVGTQRLTDSVQYLKPEFLQVGGSLDHNRGGLVELLLPQLQSTVGSICATVTYVTGPQCARAL
jgi:hypothetical protein